MPRAPKRRAQAVRKNTDRELWRTLRIGDRIRLVSLDDLKWDTLHLETKQAYKYLLGRRRPVTVYEIDATGLPWVKFRFRGKDGRIRHDFMAINHGGITIVGRAG